MIAQLRGAIVQTDQNSVIIDVGGVGYVVTVSGRTQGTLVAAGGAVTLLTDMQVREDSMTLYGFVDSSERDAFRLLVTVQGVGAKAAMAILSVLSPDALATAIMAGDKAMVTRADGVGPKLAQRVVNELAEKVGALPVSGMAASAAPAGSAPPSPATFEKEGAETESSRAGANLKAIMAAFCAPLPAPLPIFSMVAGLTSREEARLHFYDCSASRGDEGKSQRQFAC